MTIALVVAVGVLLVVVLILLGASVEMFRDIGQLRKAAGLVDETLPIPVQGQGARPSDHGLPVELDAAERHFVVFLSDICASCGAVLDSLASPLPEDVSVLVESPTEDRARLWLTRHGINSDASVQYDYDGRIAGALGIGVSPAVVVVRGGRIDSAAMVPSARQLETIRNERPTPTVAPAPVAVKSLDGRGVH